MEELRNKRQSLLIQLKHSKDLVMEASQVLNKLKSQCRDIEIEFEEVDYKLAMEGRTILPPSGTGERKQKKARDFSREEIQQIADKLKVNITFKA